MKKYISYILLSLLGCIFLPACIDDDYTELNKGESELTLSTNVSEIVLNEEVHSGDALELTWTTGTNFGTGNRITYTLDIAEAGTNFSAPYCAVENATQEYSYKKTVEELNNILLDYFGLNGGESISLEARITAKVAGQDGTQIATTAFQVTSYEPVTATLYLIGDATPNGWSADNATEMTRTSNGIFTWSGKLNPGDFKFITTLGQFLPSYNKGTDGNLVFRTSDDEPDEKYTIVETANYQVDVNLFTGVMALKRIEGEIGPSFDQLYFVGNMTSWGFEPMQQDILDPFLFRYGRFFDVGGEFKFGTANGSWENMYKAKNANASYTDTGVELIAGFDPDNKWVLQDNEQNKAYKICLDIRTGKERMMMTEFVPYEMIYLIGDATPAGWDIGNATPMEATDNPYVFTWTGNLNTGELKFTCDKKDDWGGAWFLAAKNGEAPTGEVERMLFVDKASDAFKAQYVEMSVGDVDQKWKVASAGVYTITLNQLDETVSIVKQ